MGALHRLCLAICVAALSACSSGTTLRSVYAGVFLHPIQGNLRLLDELETGSSVGEVIRQMGTDPVGVPPDIVFPNPVWATTLEGEDGVHVDLLMYAVGIYQCSCCGVPVAEAETRPLIFIDGRLVAKDWSYLEERQEALGLPEGRLRYLESGCPLCKCR